MMKLACRDVGVDCDFVATGNTAEEVKKKGMDHAMMVHKDKMDSMNEDEKKKMMMKIDEVLKDQA